MHGNDAWSAVTELAASQHGVFTRKQAADHHLTAKRIRRAKTQGLLIEIHPGVLALGREPTWLTRTTAASMAARGTDVAMRPAARLHRLRGFDRCDEIDVLVEHNRHPILEGVTVHRWHGMDTRDFTLVHGISTTTIAATIAQLGAVVDDDAVEHALDDALQRGVSERWIMETAKRLERPGPAGSNSFRRVIERPWRDGQLPESFLERLLIRVMSEGSLPRPSLQHPVRVGDRNYRLDLAWPDAKLGVAGHSREHHFGHKKAGQDNDRDLDLASAGWEIVYVTYWDAADPDRLADRLRAIHGARIELLGVRSG